MALLFESWLVELGAVFIALFTGLYLYISLKFQHWKKTGLPYVEPSFPFGNLTDLVLQRKHFGDAFGSLYWQLEGWKVGGVYQMHRPSVLVRDPELIKTVLVKDFAHFHDHGINFDEKRDPLSGHLFALEGTKWKHLRYKLTPTFTSGKMKMMFPTLVACGKELKAHLAPLAVRRDTFEIKEILARYSTDVIATCAFGIESNCMKNPDSEFRNFGRKAFQPTILGIIRNSISFLTPDLAKKLNLCLITRDVSAFFLRVVRETVEYREKFQVSRNDFMQLLINIKNNKIIYDAADVGELSYENNANEKRVENNMFDMRGMTMEEVAAQAFGFYIAGFETSSTTMSFCLYELALNQDIQGRMRDEIDSCLADHGGELTYEAVVGMDYMDRVIAETLRKYPPVSVLLRVCTKDYRLPECGVEVKKGTPLVVPVYGLHHDPQYYPQPEEFDPERFTEEAKSDRHHYAYLPFGEGPRICIGARFGLMQTKVGLASVLSSYQVDLCRESTPVPLVMDKKSIVMSAKGGINLKLTPRVEA